METITVWFFITQSKCAPSIVFRILLSAKKKDIQMCRVVLLFHMYFMTNRQTATVNTRELDMLFHPTITNPPKEKRHPSPWCVRV